MDAQKTALKKLTTCLREAESQKAELMKDLEEERRRLERETSKSEAVPSGSEADCNQSSPQVANE